MDLGGRHEAGESDPIGPGQRRGVSSHYSWGGSHAGGHGARGGRRHPRGRWGHTLGHPRGWSHARGHPWRTSLRRNLTRDLQNLLLNERTNHLDDVCDVDLALLGVALKLGPELLLGIVFLDIVDQHLLVRPIEQASSPRDGRWSNFVEYHLGLLLALGGRLLVAGVRGWV